jgi:hypothetical protein
MLCENVQNTYIKELLECNQASLIQTYGEETGEI